MSLVLRSAYWSDRGARDAFKRFIFEIHGLDFAEWESAGYWDEAYTPFTFFTGEKVVASVCIYLLDAVIRGEAVRIAQVSGVGTLPEWRRKGLNRRLTEVGLDWAHGKHRGVFLFANTEAIPFYERCGFTPFTEYVARVEQRPVEGREGCVKLDSGRKAERDKIYEYARRRAPVSNEFGVLSAKLLMFHALGGLRSHIYEIPDLGCLVFCRRDSNCLRIYDVVGARIPGWHELYPYIARESDRFIEYHFHPDKLGVEGARIVPLIGNSCFVKGTFPVPRPVFPFTCRA